MPLWCHANTRIATSENHSIGDIESIKMQKSIVPDYKIKWYMSYKVVEVVEVVPKQEDN